MSPDPPPPPPPPSVLSPAPRGRSGSGTKKQVVWIVVAAVSGGLLLVVLFVGAIVAAVFGGMKSSDPYRFAMQTATQDSRVAAKLGSPVHAGWLISGNISLNDDSGKADLSIPLQGSIHKGAIHVIATKSEGVWTYQQLTLKVGDDSAQVDLLEPRSAAPKEK